MKKILIGLFMVIVLSMGAWLAMMGKYKFNGWGVSKLAIQKPENIQIEKVTGERVNAEVFTDRTATVKILNGTTKIGVTGKFESRMLEKMEVEVTSKENAVRRGYPRSFVVDVNGRRGDVAKEIAFLLDCPITTLMPDGEATTAADLLIVIGQDYR